MQHRIYKKEGYISSCTPRGVIWLGLGLGGGVYIIMYTEGGHLVTWTMRRRSRKSPRACRMKPLRMSRASLSCKVERGYEKVCERVYERGVRGGCYNRVGR